MRKIAGSSWFIEVPHVVRSTEDIWYAVASIGTVDAGGVARVDHWVRICPANGQQGRHGQKGQHPWKEQGDEKKREKSILGNNTMVFF